MRMRLGETHLTHTAPFDGKVGCRPVSVVTEPHFVVPLDEAVEERRVHLGSRDVACPDGNVCPVPRFAATTDLDFGADERRRRVHDGGTDVTPDVEEDAALFAGSGKMMVAHGAHDVTDAGVTDGFE
jgi:hypothetical protein